MLAKKSILRIIFISLCLIAIYDTQLYAQGIIGIVRSFDSSNPEDNDGVYHPGQKIRISAEYKTIPPPTGKVQIRSNKTGYSSISYNMTKGVNNNLEFEWDTSGLKDADDYVVSITMEEPSGVSAVDNSLVIELDNTPPKISSVKSSDRSDIADNDGIYRSGQTISIDAQAEGNETALQATIQIKSESVIYDSGPQRMAEYGNGLYRYIWTTAGLNPAKDYKITVTFVDKAGLESQDSSLVIEIDNIPPQNVKVIINNDDIYTLSRSVNLKLFAEDAVRMYVSGDVVDDTSSFEWLPYTESLKVTLTSRDGNKRVSVRFADSAGNEAVAEDSIFLDELPPVIKSVKSYDETDKTDNDNIYHSGQIIIISVETDGSEPVDLDGNVQVISAKTKYDSGLQKLRPAGRGIYTYTWNTSGLVESEDYKVIVKLKDPSNREISDSSLTINLDNTPPAGGTVKTKDPETDTQSITLSISSDGDPTEMFISGDLIDDSNTFEWIPYKNSIIVNLKVPDGEKKIEVKFRDAAKNVSGITTTSIILNRKAPSSASIIIAKDAKYTTTRDVQLTLKAENASQMFIDGDVVDDDKTYQFIDYSESLQVKLLPGDGEKRVGVIFRNNGIQSDRVFDTIILDTTKPKILLLDSNDAVDLQDNDGIYRPGQTISINVRVEEAEIKAKISIKSETASYNTGEQEMSATPNGFRYTWIVPSLPGDYNVLVKITDPAGHSTEQELKLIVDSSPPLPAQLTIIEGDKTESTSIGLSIISDDADSMFISGDIVKDSNTFQWIPHRNNITVNLSGADGKKTIKVKLRDSAGNESAETSANITLDRGSPYEISIAISDKADGSQAKYITTRSAYLIISAKNAVEMYISGDVEKDFNTYRWISYKANIKVNLTEGDGEKTVSVKFRNQRWIESEQKSAIITLDTLPPQNINISSQTLNDPNDNDSVYRAGESIKIIAECTEANDPSAEISIISQANNYEIKQEVIREMRALGNSWRFEYSWDTTDLKEGDYSVIFSITDAVGWSTESQTFIIHIDNTPPSKANIIINKGDKRTASKIVNILASAEEAVEMLISGDIRRDNNTFQWVSFKDSTSVILSSGDGTKNINVKFRDKAKNEVSASASIILSENPPVIEKVDSHDSSDTEDNDEIYHAGELVALILKVQSLENAPGIETGLNVNVNIKSQDGKYSLKEKAREENGGWYSYIWDTKNLSEGKYSISWTVSDGVGHEATDNSLNITIDNTPPKDIKITLDSKRTKSRTVNIKLQAKDATYVFIDGDVTKDKGLTFEWIRMSNNLSVRITDGDGVKQIQAKFKDDADNITNTIYTQVTLDTEGPNIKTVKINNGEEHTSSRDISLTVIADEAVKMYIDGDLIGSLVRQWMPYEEKKELQLTEIDGNKTIDVELEDDVGNRKKASSSIILDSTAPKIKSVKSVNVDDPIDNDGIYVEGAQVKIEAETDENELSVTIQISSSTSGYTSSIQNMSAVGGKYEYIWDTRLLQSAEDYKARVEAKDRAGNSVIDESLIIAILSEPIEQKISINNGDKTTRSQTVQIALSADNAAEMFISGDVMDDENTFDWIKFSKSLKINLIPGDGTKKVKAEFRDSLLRIIGSSTADINLDQNPPVIESVTTTQKSYKSGDQAEISIISKESGLKAEIQIRSLSTGYDSGIQKADYQDGKYIYIWNTKGLKEDKYSVETTLMDEAGWVTKDYSLVLTIDNTPPQNGSFSMDSEVTQRRSIRLKFDIPQDAVEMFIGGDLMKDSNTFQWISVKGELIVNLTPVDEEKNISVKFRDEVGNETDPINKSIVLNELPPVITSVQTWDSDDPTDNDNIYHASQKIKVIIIIDDKELITGNTKDSNLEAFIQVSSDKVSYNSSIIAAERETLSEFSSIWNTSGLSESDDYVINATVQDNYGQKTINNSLKITIDNTPPNFSEVLIDEGKEITNSREVILKVKSEDAREMHISGDITESAITFKWIPYTETRKITLTEINGTKKVEIKLKDQAGNISDASAQIKLDRTVPRSASISVEGKEYTENFGVRLLISAENAREMFISGDVVQSEDTFKWVPYRKELDVRLTGGEGEKTIFAKFRNGVGNESKEVSTKIILDFTPPEIEKISAFDKSDDSDNDLFFHSGQIIIIKVIASEKETGLKGTVNIKSSDDSYNSGNQEITEVSNGIYTFQWNTDGLADGKYICELSLKDLAEHIVTDKLEITLDNRGPSNPSISVSSKSVDSRTVEIRLKADREPTEVFISGDVIDDNKTFEWIKYSPETDEMKLSINLTGVDGEKKIIAKFRDKFRAESPSVEASVLLDLKRPEISGSCRLIQTDKSRAYLTLRFDEAISNIDPKRFFVVLKDENNSIQIDGSTSEVLLSRDTVMVEISPEQLEKIKQWQPISLVSAYIKAEIAENGVFDKAGKGNLSNEKKPANVFFTTSELSMQANIDPTSFSPNADEIKDKILFLYTLNQTSDVTIRIISPKKELIKEWEIKDQVGGLVYPLEWNGKSDDGSPYPDGLYTMVIISSGVEANSPSYGIKKEFSIDNTNPQILEVRPYEGANIPALLTASVKVSDTPESSGIESVYITLDEDIETKFPMVESKVKGEYTVPTASEILLRPGKHNITFHVIDKAGNKAEKTLSYIVITETKPILSLMNFPNPFGPGNTTNIRYSLPEKSQSGEIAIYDAGGDMVFLKALSSSELESGEHILQWDGKDMFGRIMARGIYFCRLRVSTETGDKVKTHKIAIR